jgi:hypothetical protein
VRWFSFYFWDWVSLCSPGCTLALNPPASAPERWENRVVLSHLTLLLLLFNSFPLHDICCIYLLMYLSILKEGLTLSVVMTSFKLLIFLPACFWSAGITDVYHYTWLILCGLLYPHLEYNKWVLEICFFK